MKPAEPPNDAVMDYRGLSGYMKVAHGTLRHLVMKGEIPFIKIGRSVRFDKKRIDEWLAEQMKEPQRKKPDKEGKKSQ